MFFRTHENRHLTDAKKNVVKIIKTTLAMHLDFVRHKITLIFSTKMTVATLT